jgi:hypothetical protein
VTAPAVVAPPLLLGVDAVPLERVGELLAEYGGALAARIATPAEVVWAGPSVERIGVLLAVKEAAVKCLAGRPPGFRWQSLELDVAGGPAPEPPAVVATTLAAFGSGVRPAGDSGESGDTGDSDDQGCRVTGAALARARTLLGAAPGAAIRGVARRGTLDGHVLAAVALWEDRDREGTRA